MDPWNIKQESMEQAINRFRIDQVLTKHGTTTSQHPTIRVHVQHRFQLKGSIQNIGEKQPEVYLYHVLI